MSESKLLQRARRRSRDQLQALASEMRALREDAGISQRAVARAAGLAQSSLSGIEGGRTEPSLETLGRLAAVLGCDLSVRLFPNTGPAIRDRFQARIVEALIGALHSRWTPRLEVPVQRPARGVIDVVLEDRVTELAIATEVHSDLRRVEQQIRWAHLKAEALAERLAEDRRLADLHPADRQPEGPVLVSRLLILRSTVRTRTLVRDLAATFASEYPAEPADALRALSAPDLPWPGPALLFARVDGSAVNLFARRGPPRRPLIP
jgi:transcriptional regulator with XRE-family HTH domain